MKTTTFSISNTLKQRLYQLIITSMTFLCISCDNSEVPAAAPKIHTPKPQNLLTVTSARSESFWLEGKKQLTAFKRDSQKLHAAVESLLATPSPNTLQIAQEAWAQTERQLTPLAFYFQLADVSPQYFKTLSNLGKNISGYPIQPGYLDGFGEYPYSGIVYDIGFELSTNSLRQQNRATDNEEILLGIYAIEYVLFGENNRSSDDFILTNVLNDEQQKAGLLTPQEVPANRRNALLDLQIRILLEDVNALESLWEQTNNEALSLPQRWESLSVSQKSTTLTSATETNIAKLILSVVDITQTLNTSPESDAATFSKLNTLSVHLDASVQAFTLLLPEQKKGAIDKLHNAQTKLQILKQMVNPEETGSTTTTEQKVPTDTLPTGILKEKQETLQHIYQEIQSASSPTHTSK